MKQTILVVVVIAVVGGVTALFYPLCEKQDVDQVVCASFFQKIINKDGNVETKTPTVEPLVSAVLPSSPIFDIKELKVGDVVSGLKVKSITATTNPSNWEVVFDGRAIVTGVFYGRDEQSMSPGPKFGVYDSLSETKLPRTSSLSYENFPDIIFNVSNPDLALTKIPENATTTILIEDYRVFYILEDNYPYTARFVDVVR